MITNFKTSKLLFYKKHAKKIILKSKRSFIKFPYKLNPFVKYGESPYMFVAFTFSLGMLGFEKRAKRSKKIYRAVCDLIDIYMKNYFYNNKIDFFFFKFNGNFKFIKYFKRNIKNVFKKVGKRMKYVAKNITWNIAKIKERELVAHKIEMDFRRANVLRSRILNTPVSHVKSPYLLKIGHKEKQRRDRLNSKNKAKISLSVVKLLYITRILPHFVYMIDRTSYPFNGCRRVRHYKK
jgi:hypothetical protein